MDVEASLRTVEAGRTSQNVSVTNPRQREIQNEKMIRIYFMKTETPLSWRLAIQPSSEQETSRYIANDMITKTIE